MDWINPLVSQSSPVQADLDWTGSEISSSADSGLDWIEKCAMCNPYLEIWGAFTLS